MAPLVVLAGCGSPSGNLFKGSTADLSGNWQIQTSANSTTAAPSGVVLLGAIEGSGGQFTGTFRFTNLAQSDACGQSEVVTATGSVDSKGGMMLNSAPLSNGTTVKVSLKLTDTPPYSGIGSVEVDGKTCTFASAPAIGTQVASTTGTFTGTLAPGRSEALGSVTPGTATVTLTQAANPNPDGEFAETGTLTYQMGACSGNVPLKGTVSGVAMNFWEVVYSADGDQEQVNLTGTTDLAASQINAGYLSIAPAPCSADPNSSAIFKGQLNRN
ncbi:MAG TPA: hypothetical protein VGS10_15540 [Terracidiphilus sp.]|nr:hypothetical protein [Terracidiphilus sp.]